MDDAEARPDEGGATTRTDLDMHIPYDGFGVPDPPRDLTPPDGASGREDGDDGGDDREEGSREGR
ncbi:MAG: hypothetical protein ACJ77N_06995 [Chloroflexota bacterium]|jgi:hypothetical protein